jgi:hypothetical protein
MYALMRSLIVARTQHSPIRPVIRLAYLAVGAPTALGGGAQNPIAGRPDSPKTGQIFFGIRKILGGCSQVDATCGKAMMV